MKATKILFTFDFEPKYRCWKTKWWAFNLLEAFSSLFYFFTNFLSLFSFFGAANLCQNHTMNPDQLLKLITYSVLLKCTFVEYVLIHTDTHTPLSIYIGRCFVFFFICSIHHQSVAQRKTVQFLWKQSEQCSIKPVHWFKTLSACHRFVTFQHNARCVLK